MYPRAIATVVLTVLSLSADAQSARQPGGDGSAITQLSYRPVYDMDSAIRYIDDLLEVRRFNEVSALLQLALRLSGEYGKPQQRLELLQRTSRLALISGQPVQVINAARHARRIGNGFQASEAYIGIMMDYGEAMVELGRSHKALKQYRSMLQTMTTLSEKPILYADLLTRKADLLTQRGRYKEATAVCHSVISALQGRVPETDIRFVTVLKQLGTCLLKSGRPHTAYVYLRWAYDVAQRSEETDASVVLEINSQLAAVCRARGDESGAATLYAAQHLLSTE